MGSGAAFLPFVARKHKGYPTQERPSKERFRVYVFNPRMWFLEERVSLSDGQRVAKVAAR